MARKVVLAGACRTAIGVMGGTLSKTPAPDLGTVVIKEALKRTGIKPEQVDEVYMGCVIQAGLGQNPARQAAVNAGIPVEVPATTINVLCGSGMHCVNLAAKLIASGDADIIVAGGRGMGSKENFDKLYELADAIGGVVGATRPLVEKGWIELPYQVGQTGKTVSPKLYLAFGISGAIQHVSGISGADTIVAINNDPKAEIFQHANYGIVGDCMEVLNDMLAHLK